MFDNLVAIDCNDSKVSVRKEIHTLANGTSIIMDDLIIPLMSNDGEFKAEMLDSLDGEKISNVFKELSELEIIGLAMPVGVEVAPGFIKSNQGEDSDLYIYVNDAAKELKNVDFQKVIAQTGEFIGSLYDCIFDTEFKPSDLMGEDDNLASRLLDRLVNLEPEKVDEVFDKLASIDLVDAINNIGLNYIRNSSLIETKINPYLLIKPIMTVSEDGYLILNDNKTNISYLEEMNFDDFDYSLDENGYWVIEYSVSENKNTLKTTINGTSSQMTLSFEDVKLSDEIRNISNLVNALRVLSVDSVSDLQEFIKNGNAEEINFNLNSFTYENVNNLYKALFGFKIISNNIDNVDVVVNNVLPNDLRGSVNLKGINENDLTSVTMAAKVLYDTGIINSLTSSSEEGVAQEIDYVKIIDDYGETIIDYLLDSKLISGNITPVSNAMITMFVGKDSFNIPDINWQEEGKELLHGILKVTSVVLKYRDKFSDLPSLTDEELDEIFDILIDKVASNDIIKQNMNNAINYISGLDSFKEMNIQLRTLDSDDDWTTEELTSIVNSLKIVLKLLTSGEEFQVTKLFELKESDIDTILGSKFFVKVLVANLIEYAKDSNDLADYLVINLEENDARWNNELDVILKILIKLMDGVTDLNDDITNKLVKNLTKLSVESTDNTDDVSKILSSVVLTDSLIKIIKKLPEETDNLIVVNDTELFPIEWRDTQFGDGEIRSLIKGIEILLIDDEGNVIIDEINNYNTNQFIDLLIGISEEETETISKSRILVDTVANKLIEMSEESDSFIALSNDYSQKTWDKAYFTLWSGEVKRLIISAKTLVLDSNGNSMASKLTSGNNNDLLSVIIELGDDEVKIGKVLDSDIIYETIKKQVKDLSESSSGDAIISMPTGEDDIELWDRDDWKVELKAVIYAIDKILTEEVEDPDNPGSTIKQVNIDKLSSSDADKLLQVIVDLTDEELNKSLESRIITATISKQILKLGEDGSDKIICTKSVTDYDLAEWKVEIVKIVDSVELLVCSTDTNGKKIVDTSVLNNGDTDSILQMIVDLNNGKDEDGVYHEENDEIKVVLSSIVILDTISEKIIEIGDETDAVIVVKDDVRNYTQDEWKVEIRNIIESSNALLTDEAGNVSTDKLNSGDTDAILQMVVDLDNGKDNDGVYHEENDEIKVVLSSIVILDTISQKIVEIGDGGDAVIVIKDDVKAYDRDEWKVEIRNIIESSKLLLTDEAGNVSTSSLSSGDTNKILKLVADLDDGYSNTTIYNANNDEVAIVLKSVVISDTISEKIIDLGVDDSGQPDDNKTLVVKNVYLYSRLEWQGNDDNHYNGEIKKIIKSSNILLREEDPITGEKSININKVTNANSNELFELICNLSDDELDEVVKSTLFTDTISKQVISFEGTLTISNDVKAYTTDDWRSETVRLIKSARLVVGEKVGDKYTIDMNKVSSDSNYVVNNIANLHDNPNGENDELGIALASVVIRDTLVSKIEDQGKDKGNGGILVIQNVIWDDTIDDNIITHIGEIRRIIRGLKIIFEEDDPLNPGEKKVNIALENVNANEILSRTRELNDVPGVLSLGVVSETDEIGVLVQSKIISETIIDTTVSESEKENAVIVVKYARTDDAWFDIYTGNTFNTSGELRKMLASVKYLFKGEDEINLNSFNVDNILSLDEGEEDIVFSSNILLDTFYSEIKNLNSTNPEEKVLFIPDGMDENKVEAINFIESIKVVKGDKQIKDLNSTQFSLDTFIKEQDKDDPLVYNYKTDSEYDTLFGSLIVKYSVSIRTRDYLTNAGSLSQYIELDKTYEGNAITGTEDEIKETQVEMIEEDIENLIKVIRDLDKNNGIVYTNFSFAAFKDACIDTEHPDATDKADSVADTLVESKLIVHSLKKMMTEVLSGSLSNEQMNSIDLDMEKANRNYWCNLDINENDEIENITIDPENNIDDETGELRKILRLLTKMDSFAKDTGTTYSSMNDKEEITKPLLLINNSLVLKGLIPEFTETALSNIKDWLYNPRSELTKVMWDSEIDNLADIIVTINDRGLGNMNNLDVKTANTTDLGYLLKDVNKSRIIDISHLEGYVQDAVNSTFGTTVTVTHVYDSTEFNYNDKVQAWNVEIDKLMSAVDNLQAIEDTDISDKGAYATEIPPYKGVHNARAIGKFLDSCKESTMLHDVIEDVFDQIMTDNGVTPLMLTLAGIDISNIDSYETTLVAIATYLCTL